MKKLILIAAALFWGLSAAVPAPECVLEGWLTEGVDQRTVLRQWGEPDSMSVEWIAEAFGGERVCEWYYKKKGIMLEMWERGNSMAVGPITMLPSCTMKTNQDMGIGTPRSEVEARFRDIIYHPEEGVFDPGDEWITVGDPYDGAVLYKIDDGVVSEITIRPYLP